MMAGIEGVWGTIFWLIILPIVENLPCNAGTGICTRYGYLEGTLNAFREYGKNPQYIVMSTIVVLAMPFLYASAFNITKYGSAAARTTIETGRQFLIWGFFLFIPVYGVYVEHFILL
jgi:hypothetical protein